MRVRVGLSSVILHAKMFERCSESSDAICCVCSVGRPGVKK